MQPKYKIEYAMINREHHLANDPIEAEEFLSCLLQRGFRIFGILHQGVELPREEFDRMIKTAAGILTTRNLCRSLDIDSNEAHDRFGTPA
jgi:hypothetical protein